MDMTRNLKLLLAVAILIPASATIAAATDAMATTALNVRSGPSSAYGVVDVLTPGEVVDATNCQPNGWCHITHPGPDGWVSSSFLTAAPGAGSPGPDCRFELSLGPGGPRFDIVCGDGPAPGPAPGPTPATNRACFFDGPNFTGQNFCRTVGLYSSLPPISNDRITSVQLHGSAKVRLCEHNNMGPFCRDVVTSVGQLGGFLNNKVSSLRVYTGGLAPKKQVCLFDGPNYTGQYLCYGVGTRTLPASAFNKATSVRVMGGAMARLSKSPTYGIGGALPLSSNVATLPALWNNQTKSLRVQ